MASPNQAPISSSTAEYRKLAVTLEQAGLYKTDITQYYYIAALLASLFAATFWLVGHGHIFLGAFTIGAFWQQVCSSSIQGYWWDGDRSQLHPGQGWIVI